MRWSAMVCDASRSSKSQENYSFYRSVWLGLLLIRFPLRFDYHNFIHLMNQPYVSDFQVHDDIATLSVRIFSIIPLAAYT